MPPIDVNQPFDLFGMFWTSNAPEKRVPGRLYRTSDGIRVQLFEDLRPGPSYVPHHQEGEDPVFEQVPSPDIDKPLTLLGQIGGLVGKITAYECMTLRATSDFFGRNGEYVLSPRDVVVGAHTLGENQKFVGVRVRTRDLDEWADLPGFSATRSEDGARGLHYKFAPIDSAQLSSGAVLALRQMGCLTGPTLRGGSISREVWLEVGRLAPSTWPEIDSQVITPICSLISLCFGEYNGPTGIQLTVDGDTWVDLASQYIQHAEPSRRAESLADLNSLQLAGVGAWLEKTDRLGPLPPVVAHFASRRSTVKIETEILEMTTVAEGLHMRLFPEERRFDDEICEEVRSRVLGAVDDMEQQVKNVLNGMLTHLGEPGYTKRLKGLAGIMEPIAPAICGKINRWAEEVSEVRNKYAHRTAGFLDGTNIDGLVTVLESLRWLLRCVLLLEAGVGPEVLAAQLRDSSAYRIFCERAAQNLPSVYAS